MRIQRARGTHAALSMLAAVSALALVTAQSRTSLGQAAPAGSGAKPAAAPPTESAKKEAGEHFQKGLSLYREQSYDGAIIEFRRAYDLAPSYKVLYNIAIAYRDKGDKANALRFFEQYLAEAGTDVEAKRKTEIETEVARFHSFVAEVSIKTNVAGAEITIDDDVVGHSPLDRSIYLNLGRHRIGATKDGFVAASKSVTVASGDKLPVTLELKDANAVAAPPPVTASAAPQPPPPPTASTTTASPPPPAPPPEVSHTGAYVAYGVGGVGLIVGVVGGLLAAGTYKTAKDGCPTFTGCSQASIDDRNSALTKAWVSDVGFGVAVVGAVVGTVLLLTDGPSSESASTASTTPRFDLGLAGTHGAAASFRGNF